MKCKVCGANAESDYCFKHKPRKPLAKSRIVAKTPVKKTSELRDFFLQIWNKRPHYSEVSGKWLGKEPLSVFFHHILPKEKYPQAAFDEENIILLTLEEHDQVEMDVYRYEEVNLKRTQMICKYART